jgi:hypothetical protein
MERGETCATCAHSNAKEGEEPCKKCLAIEDKGGEPFSLWEPKGAA